MVYGMCSALHVPRCGNGSGLLCWQLLTKSDRVFVAHRVCRRQPTMAVLAGLSVLAGVGPVMFLINADIKTRGLGAALVMAALAGFLASIAGVCWAIVQGQGLLAVMLVV
jgi:hypothetical protein